MVPAYPFLWYAAQVFVRPHLRGGSCIVSHSCFRRMVPPGQKCGYGVNFFMDTDLTVPVTQAFLDGLPVPVQIYRVDGLAVATNRASEQFWGAPREILVGQFNMVTDPQNVELGVPAIFQRVAQGENVHLPPVFYDSTKLPGMETSGSRRWVTVDYFPIRNEQNAINHVGVMHRDVTDEVEKSQAIEAAQEEINRQRELITSLEEAHRQIETQQATIRELSSPISQIWNGVLVVPLIGTIDAQRATMMTENLLEAIVHHQADIVIIDITGVPVVDTQVADYLVNTTTACKLLGSKVVLVGIGSAIAQAMVHLEVDLSGIVTLANLQTGIAWTFEQLGLQVMRK